MQDVGIFLTALFSSHITSADERPSWMPSAIAVRSLIWLATRSSVQLSKREVLRKYISCCQLRDDETQELTTPPSFFNEKFFNDLYKLAELNNFTAEELRNYMKRLFAVSDYENTIEFAKAESRAEERLKNAKNLKTLGVDLDIIAQGLGLDRKTVEEL